MAEQKELRLVCLNARSAANKAEQLEAVIFSYDPHVIMITETWLHDDIQDSEVMPPNYRLIRRDRSSRGGGVAIAVKEDIVCRSMKSIENFESVWCQINFFGTWLTLGTVYRRPGSSPDDLKHILEYLLANTNKCSRIVIGGDFNAPDVSWSNEGVACPGTKLSEVLVDIAFSRCLRQSVEEPTRITDRSSNLLDLLFVSKHFDHCSVTVHEGISDHKLVFLKCNLDVGKKDSAQVKQYYDYERANDESVIDYLEEHLDGFEERTDVNEMWLKFKSITEYCLSNFIPKKTKTTKRHNPWITREILQAKRKLKRLRKRHSPAICEQNGKLKTLIKLAKEAYFTKSLPEFISSSPEKFWRYLTPSRTNISQLRINNNVVNDKAKMSSEFNHYFQSVFTIESSDRSSIPNDERSNVSDFVSEQGIVSLLLSINARKSPGPDAVPNEFLKRYAEWVAKYLTRIFFISLRDSVLPDDWLIARVVPVKKSGKSDSIDNYRPISLTCTSCKLLEHIVNKQLISFMEDKGILSPNQHGFRKGLSTTTQLIECYHEISGYVNNRLQVDAIFIDLSKAFDRVPHRKLIKVLIDYDVPPLIIRWISAYLNNRRQFVDVNGTFSELLEVYSGVPQGSVLGPLLFLIYINSLFSIGSTGRVKVRMFADDCIIYAPISSVNDQIEVNDILYRISSWCGEKNMIINTQKTQYMHLTNKKNILYFDYELDSVKLTKVDRYKYLGVIITSDLKWNEHVDYVAKKATKKLWYLRRKLLKTPPSVKLIAYKALVRPTLEYASEVWDPWQATLSNELEKVQSLAVRTIFSDFRTTTSVTELKKQAAMQPLKERRICQRMKLFFQIYNHLLQIDSSKYVTPKKHRSERLHHTKVLEPINARINIFKQSFFVQAIEFWNKLPGAVVALDSTADFEEALRVLFQ